MWGPVGAPSSVTGHQARLDRMDPSSAEQLIASIISARRGRWNEGCRPLPCCAPASKSCSARGLTLEPAAERRTRSRATGPSSLEALMRPNGG